MTITITDSLGNVSRLLIEQLEFILQLHLTDIRLMVQDWGGPIGLGVAGRRPDLFHSLLIGNTWAWPTQNSPRLARFSRIVGSTFGQSLGVESALPSVKRLPLNNSLFLKQMHERCFVSLGSVSCDNLFIRSHFSLHKKHGESKL